LLLLAAAPAPATASLAPTAKRTYATVDATEANLNNNNRALTPRARSAQVSLIASAQFICIVPRLLSTCKTHHDRNGYAAQWRNLQAQEAYTSA
jgi:hypothetical protein